MCHITDEYGNDVPEVCRVPHGQKVPSLRRTRRASERDDDAEHGAMRASDDSDVGSEQTMVDDVLKPKWRARWVAGESDGVGDDARATSRDDVGERDARAGRARAGAGYASAPKISRLMRDNPNFSALEALLTLARD